MQDQEGLHMAGALGCRVEETSKVEGTKIRRKRALGTKLKSLSFIPKTTEVAFFL